MVRAAALILSLFSAPVGPETIDLGNSTSVDLSTFDCRDINRSTVVQRVCYSASERTLLVAVRGSYQHYCGVPTETYDALMIAPSMGVFLNRVLRIAGADGRYACRTS
ncbi:KTSC domain-containing protein [Bradyrhizobium sp. CCBAU 53421]|uniref:KTSC domain-containing protein n=1 Tax=Bradyrhizobium sp. CCBAU 53421 TaxID=1325120 RepID=UPI00188BFC45|nr:KTSC domain-containing protein [Bradyrhizobium sp. CCBAU 53421]QOZ34207.1 KTSC domain-containing protein [Bradyrhizobium sp. CCBAU 53421]